MIHAHQYDDADAWIQENGDQAADLETLPSITPTPKRITKRKKMFSPASSPKISPIKKCVASVKYSIISYFL